MSKITRALEKAALERLQREQPPVIVSDAPVMVKLLSDINAITPIGQTQVDPHIVCAAEAASPIAEQYRMLKANLQSMRRRANIKTIVMTSAMVGEGKSVTSINLALTLARQEHLKVVLVDADMRRSSIHRWLGLGEPAHGLSTALQQNGALNGSLVRLGSPALTILPSGPHPQQPAELLASSNMRRILETLKAQFDLVIIDTPPVLSVSDSSILAAQADGVLLMVKAGRTQLKTILEAKARLEQVKATLLGCVLTHAHFFTPGYNRYYREYYKEKARHAAATPASVR